MKYKVAEIEGRLLDAAVAKAVGYTYLNGEKISAPFGHSERLLMRPALTIDDSSEWFEPSTCWGLGGQIIDRKRISVMRDAGDIVWTATTKFFFQGGIEGPSGEGPTALIAAMRCCVAAEFGEEVELP